MFIQTNAMIALCRASWITDRKDKLNIDCDEFSGLSFSERFICRVVDPPFLLFSSGDILWAGGIKQIPRVGLSVTLKFKLHLCQLYLCQGWHSNIFCTSFISQFMSHKRILDMSFIWPAFICFYYNYILSNRKVWQSQIVNVICN